MYCCFCSVYHPKFPHIYVVFFNWFAIPYSCVYVLCIGMVCKIIKYVHRCLCLVCNSKVHIYAVPPIWNAAQDHMDISHIITWFAILNSLSICISTFVWFASSLARFTTLHMQAFSPCSLPTCLICSPLWIHIQHQHWLGAYKSLTSFNVLTQIYASLSYWPSTRTYTKISLYISCLLFLA